MNTDGPLITHTETATRYMTVRSWATGEVEIIEREPKMTAPALLLWTDLETTGDDPFNDVILEFGAVLTDSKLRRIAEFNWIVKDPLAKALLESAPEVVRDMHEKSGLAALIRAGMGISLGAVERDIMAGLRDALSEGETVVLAGSGVGHLDFPFIKAQMTELRKMLAYYVIDVGVLRRTFEMWGHADLLMKKEDKPHRALADADLHLREAITMKCGLRDLESLAFPNRVKLGDGTAVINGRSYPVKDMQIELEPGEPA